MPSEFEETENQHKVWAIKPITLGQIPSMLLDQIKEEIAPFSVAILAVVEEKTGQKADLIGSGTLIKVGNKYGVLTVEHLISSRGYRNANLIGLTLPNYFHNFTIPKSHLETIIVGERTANSLWPDLAVILLPGDVVGSISARKSFWEVEKFHSQLLKNPIKLNNVNWAISGCLDVYNRIEPSDGNFGRKIHLHCMVGYGGVIRGWTQDNFDYYDFRASYTVKDQTPSTFKGVSGGGLWTTVLYESSKDKIDFMRPVLSGVAFYESDVNNNERSIYCHGRRSIYDSVYEGLVNH